jgi:hypothetical protein
MTDIDSSEGISPGFEMLPDQTSLSENSSDSTAKKVYIVAIKASGGALPAAKVVQLSIKSALLFDSIPKDQIVQFSEATSCLKLVGGVGGILAIPLVISNVKTLHESHDTETKSIAGLELVQNIHQIGSSGIQIADALNALGVVTIAVDWIPFVNLASAAVGIIGIGLKGHAIRRLNELNQEISTLNKFPLAEPEKKAEILKSKLDDLLQKCDKMKRKLEVSGKGLEEQITKIQETVAYRLNKKDFANLEHDAQKLEELTIKLKKRIRQQVKLHALDIAIKVASVVGLVLLAVGSIFFPPLIVVGVIILCVTAGASLGLWGGKMFFVNKDPFDPNSKTLAKRALDSFMKTLAKARGKLEKPEVYVPLLALASANRYYLTQEEEKKTKKTKVIL